MTLWHKPAYQPSDRDPATGDLIPGALPPGLYCEDEEAFSKLRAAERLRNSAVRGTLSGGWDLAGQAVFVCTPEQARMYRAIASKAPPPPAEPEPDPANRMLAEVEERMQALGAQADRQVALATANAIQNVVGDGPILPEADYRTELSGEVRVTLRKKSRGVRDLAEAGGATQRVKHPFVGANRSQRRAAEARRRP